MSNPVSPNTNPDGVGQAADGTPLDRPSTDPNASGANDQPYADAVRNASTIESSNRDELIRQAAYRRFQERGGAAGSEEQDWLDAEAEINASIGGG